MFSRPWHRSTACRETQGGQIGYPRDEAHRPTFSKRLSTGLLHAAYVHLLAFVFHSVMFGKYRLHFFRNFIQDGRADGIL